MAKSAVPLINDQPFFMLYILKFCVLLITELDG